MAVLQIVLTDELFTDFKKHFPLHGDRSKVIRMLLKHLISQCDGKESMDLKTLFDSLVMHSSVTTQSVHENSEPTI